MKNKKGFTLIEVMATIIILAVIMAMTIPNFIKNSKDSSTVNFSEQLKTLNNVIQMLSEVQTNNYKHYPHPLLIDYTQVQTDSTNMLGVNANNGIPYTSGIDKTSNDYYYTIKLNANTNGDAIVTKTYNGGVIDTTTLPSHLKTVLQTKYGRNAELKAFPLDVDTLTRYAAVPFSLNYPKSVMNGYSDNKLQNKSVWQLNLSTIFLNNAIVTSGTSTDANDRVPNDGLIEKSGYYILIISDKTSSVLYTGTDSIYQKQYINMAGF